MRKILIVLVGLIIVGLFSYFVVWELMLKPKPMQKISFVIFNNNVDTTLVDNALNKFTTINKDIIGSELNVNILVKSKNTAQEYKIESQQLFSKVSQDKILRKKILELLPTDDYEAESDEETDSKIMQIMNFIENTGVKEFNTIYLVGAFPDCYSDASQAAQHILKGLVSDTTNINKKNKFDNIKIVWLLKSNQNEPEQEILKAFESAGIQVVNEQITVGKRQCPELDVVHLHTTFFSPIAEKDYGNFIGELHRRFGDNLLLNVYVDSQLNNMQISLVKDKVDADIKSKLTNLKKGNWSSINFLIKQNANILSALPSEDDKKMIIVGPMPKEGRGNQLTADIWDLFKSLENLNGFVMLPRGVTPHTENAFIKELKLVEIYY